jgi:hypothetical protein
VEEEDNREQVKELMLFSIVEGGLGYSWRMQGEIRVDNDMAQHFADTEFSSGSTITLSIRK